MENEDKKYIGTGWNFPVGVDAAGKIRLVTGNDDIELGGTQNQLQGKGLIS